VRQLIKTRDKVDSRAPSGLTAQVLNRHYATVSTDSRYEMPPVKQTASFPYCFVTEIEMFRILDRLKPTVTWLDGLPAWFLRLGAPYLQPHWPTCLPYLFEVE